MSAPADLAVSREAMLFRAAFGACAVLALLPIWIPKCVPMTDLPQHAAQVAIWMHYDDPATGYGDVYEIRYFTPYLAGYALLRLFASIVPMWAAAKVLLSLVVLGTAWSLLVLLRQLGHRPWWSLLGFATAYGYPFLWGFLNYLVAVPIGTLYLAYVLRHRASTRLLHALGLFAASTGLFFAHVIVFAVYGAGTALLAAFSGNARSAPRRLAPFVAAASIAAIWMAFAGQGVEDAPIPDIYAWGLHRFTELPGLLFGYPSDPAARVTGLTVFGLLIVGGLRLAAPPARWLPLIIWVIAYMALPQDWRNVAFLYPRLAVLLLPLIFVASIPSLRPLLRPSLHSACLAVLASCWLVVVLLRFAAFDSDARQIDGLFAAMQPGRRVRAITFERGSEYLEGGAPFLHHAVWYEVEKAGYSGFSFAHTSASLVHYRHGRRPPRLGGRDPWIPRSFDAALDAVRYDYFIVRSVEPRGSEVFQGSTVPIRFVLQSGKFWLYERIDPDAVRPR